MRKFVLLACFVLLAFASFAQTQSNSVTFTVSNPLPTLSSLTPSSATTGSTSLTLTLNGTNFVSTTTATFNSVAHSFTFVSATQGSIVLTTAELSTAGNFPVCVANPSPGGGSSNCLTFQVATPLSLTSLVPNGCVIYGTCGSVGLTVTVNGTGFVAGSVVQWGGVALTTTFVNATQLKATVSATNLNLAGQYQVTVQNPAGTGTARVIEVIWNPADPNNGTISYYNVYRWQGIVYAPVLISGAGVFDVLFDDTSAQAGQTYNYVVRSVAADGTESLDSNQATATAKS